MGAGTPAQITLTVDGMHCASCGLLVDDVLEDLPGVLASSTDVKRGRTEVRLDPAVIDVTDLVVAVSAAGYAAHLESQ